MILPPTTSGGDRTYGETMPELRYTHIAGIAFAGFLAGTYVTASILEPTKKSLELYDFVITTHLIPNVGSTSFLNDNAIPQLDPASTTKFSSQDFFDNTAADLSEAFRQYHQHQQPFFSRRTLGELYAHAHAIAAFATVFSPTAAIDKKRSAVEAALAAYSHVIAHPPRPQTYGEIAVEWLVSFPHIAKDWRQWLSSPFEGRGFDRGGRITPHLYFEVANVTLLLEHLVESTDTVGRLAILSKASYYYKKAREADLAEDKIHDPASTFQRSNTSYDNSIEQITRRIDALKSIAPTVGGETIKP